MRAPLDAVVGGRKLAFGTGPDWGIRPSGYSHIGHWTWNSFGGERIDAAERDGPGTQGNRLESGPSTR